MRPVQSGTQNSILLAVLSNYFHSFRSPAFFISEIITFSHLFQSIAVSAKVIHRIVYMPTLVRFEMLSCLIAECLIFNTAAYLLRLRVHVFVCNNRIAIFLQSSSSTNIHMSKMPQSWTYVGLLCRVCMVPQHLALSVLWFMYRSG